MDRLAVIGTPREESTAHVDLLGLGQCMSWDQGCCIRNRTG